MFSLLISLEELEMQFLSERNVYHLTRRNGERISETTQDFTDVQSLR